MAVKDSCESFDQTLLLFETQSNTQIGITDHVAECVIVTLRMIRIYRIKRNLFALYVRMFCYINGIRRKKYIGRDKILVRLAVVYFLNIDIRTNICTTNSEDSKLASGQVIL